MKGKIAEEISSVLQDHTVLFLAYKRLDNLLQSKALPRSLSQNNSDIRSIIVQNGFL
ncbi:unnamed protein product [Brugia timori]|uniref:Uncharacterized protein n=1 Tax=Brugia timori TaxID=42155 RepID=A0A3P7T3C0_9BILA|nr:unnamed protein product [Brugia timori]